MAISLIPVLIVLAAALLLIGGVVALTKRQDAHVDEAERPTTATLRYRVPEGQDPAAVLLAVREAGYDAVAERDLVVVSLPADSRERREQLRSVIAGTGVNVEDDAVPAGNPVRFVDE